MNVNLVMKALEYRRNDHIESTWTFNGINFYFIREIVSKPFIFSTDEKQLAKFVSSNEENEEEGHFNKGRDLENRWASRGSI